MGIKFSDLEKAKKYFSDQGMSAEEVQKEIERTWEKNNMLEQIYKAHSDLLVNGYATIKLNDEIISIFVVPNGYDLVIGKD